MAAKPPDAVAAGDTEVAGERVVRNMWDVASDLDGGPDDMEAIRQAAARIIVNPADDARAGVSRLRPAAGRSE